MVALAKAHSAPFDETALRSPSLAGSYEGIASAKPPLVKENTVWLPKFKSLKHQGALDPTQDDQKAEGQEAASAQAVEKGASGNSDRGYQTTKTLQAS